MVKLDICDLHKRTALASVLTHSMGMRRRLRLRKWRWWLGKRGRVGEGILLKAVMIINVGRFTMLVAWTVLFAIVKAVGLIVPSQCCETRVEPARAFLP